MRKRNRMTGKGIALLMAAVLLVSSVITYLPVLAVEAADADSSDSTNLTDSLVGYYTFDDTLENTASSVTSAASDNAGTGSASLHGGAGTTWNSAATGTENYSSDGYSGSAYEFLGNSNIETLSGTAWWTGSETGQDYSLEDGDTLTFTVACTADVSSYAAFSVELYDASGNYFTTGSDGNGWFAGNASGTVSGALSTLNSTITSGTTYTVTVARSGNVFTVTYYDETAGSTFVNLVGTSTVSFDSTMYVHFMAQVGTFKITNTSGSESSGEGLELDLTTTEEFTISMWVNTSQKEEYQPILFAINDSSYYVTAGTYYNSFASGGIANYNNTWYWLDQNNNSSSTLKDLPIDTWTYVTLTMTSDGVATLYYNGEVLSTQTISGYDSSYYTNMPIYLGINWWNASFCGLMDEVVVYESALTEDEVYTLYSCDGDPDAAAEAEESGELATAVSHVTVHDPSIVKGYVAESVTTIDSSTDIIGEQDSTHTKAIYFIFGSHLAFAYSWDLVDWTYYYNNITTDYETLFAEEAAWSANGSSSYDLSGNMWAPDVIWVSDYDNGDGTTGAWCMYMSINGDYWYSTICMLTSDSLSGDWTHVGMVIQSGNYAYASTGATFDYYEATGETEDNNNLSRYTANRNGNLTYEDNCIDPCVTYDEEGNLWMTYGSWFGGIWMIKLDGTTGLRDYTTTYEYVVDESDPYQGYKIAQGYHSSGEASYIEYIDGYYYLFVTYGGLTATGGYNMRVYRSEDITGPYVDESGDTAVYSSYQNNVNSTLGMRLMSYYKWSYQTYAQVAQGHNSVYYDQDTDQIYLVYHTRTNDGTEGHSVRVHQLFVNEDGWLVTAPFEYTGETTTNEDITTTSYDADEIIGTYEVLLQAQSIDYANLAYVEPIYIALGSDGSISGDLTGTWTTTDGTCYITLTTDTDTYHGVLLTQRVEGKTTKTITFTGVGVSTETAIWGYQFSGTDALEMEAEALTLPAQTVNGTSLDLYTDGIYGTTITWTSSDESIVATDGTVTVPATTTDVTLTATISNDAGEYIADYVVTVLGEDATDEDGNITVWSTDETFDLTDAVQGTYQYVNYFNNETGTAGLDLNYGISIEFTVEQTGDYAYLSNILGINAGASGGLYFTGGSYLGYNATGGYFDANVDNTNWIAGTDYISGEGEVTFRIEIYSYKYEVYVNDELVYSNSSVDSGDTSGSNSIDTYYSVLTYLNSTATEFDLGWGSWWDGGFAGTISNITLTALAAETTDTTGYIYYEDFQTLAGQTGSGTKFTSAYVSSYLNVVSEDYEDWYLEFANSGASGNRSAYALFDETVQELTTYTVEVDTALTAGILAQRSVSEFVIFGEDASGYTGNNGVSSGYILKLHNEPPTTSAAQSNDSSLQTTWYINDTDETVEIPVGTWIHIQADVDVEAGTAEITITNRETEEVLYTGTVEVNGSGVLGGLYLLNGRGVGETLVDNIAVSCIHQWDEGVVTTEATCTEDGEILYTCAQCGETYTEVIEASHDWDYDNLVWTWSTTDYTDVTVMYYCKNDSTHYETVTADVEITESSATCTVAGNTVYTASVELDGTTYTQEKTVDGEALGHDYEEEWIWAEDYSSATLTLTCTRDGCDDVQKIIAEVDNDTTAATCEEDGSIVYTATATYDDVDYSDEKTVTLTATGHSWDYSILVWEWADDYSSATVTYYCSNDGTHSQTDEATVTSEVTTAATCEGTGVRTYTASVTLDGTVYTNEVEETIDALGHSYEESWTWAEDYSSATLTLTCTRDGCGDVQKITAEVDNDTTAATCEEDGSIVYTAEAEYDGVIYTDEKTVTLTATGHSWDYSYLVWEWADDYSSATVTYYCSNDGTHSQTDEATVTSEVTTAATCEEIGVRTYTASVTLNGTLYTDEKAETIAALGHSYEESWTWAEDYGSATLTLTCIRDGCTNVQTPEVTVTSATTPATCEADGSIVYTATAEYDNVEYSDTYTVTLAALGHDWDYDSLSNDSIEWASDYSSAWITYYCNNDSSHSVTEYATVSSETTAATCEKDGSVVYTATIEVNGTEYTSTREVTLYALGHSYSKPTFEWDASTTVPSVTITVDCERENCDGDGTWTLTLSDDASTTFEETGAAVAYTSTSSDGSNVVAYTVTYTLNGVVYSSTMTVTTTSDDSTTRGLASDTEVESSVSAAVEDAVQAEAEANGLDSDNLVTSYYDVTLQEYSDATGTWTTIEDADAIPEDGVTVTIEYPNSTNSGYTFLVTAVDANGQVVVLTADEDYTLTDDGIVLTVKSLYSTVAVSYVCEHDYVGTVTTEATCTTDGVMTYVCSICGDTYTEAISATGHTYGEPTFTWSSDYSSATATFTCTVCGGTYTVDATVTSVVADGVITYTATVTLDGVDYTNIQTVDASAEPDTNSETETEPEDGDSSLEDKDTGDAVIFIWMLLAMMGGAAIIAAGNRRKADR